MFLVILYFIRTVGVKRKNKKKKNRLIHGGRGKFFLIPRGQKSKVISRVGFGYIGIVMKHDNNKNE